MIYLHLFLGFLRVGCFSFGGAYAAIPLIRDVVLSYGWLTEDTLTYMIAVSESTPGPIMVNLATYIGSSQAGILGAALATAAVVLPAFCIILLVVLALKHILKNEWVQAALCGLKPCVIGVIFATGVHMLYENCMTDLSAPDPRSILIALLLAGTLLGAKYLLHRKLSSIALLGISAVLGAVIFAI